MDRNRDARRAAMAATNGLSRQRRHRSSSLRDSPEDDGPVELQETSRLRDRKKDRDRDRDRDRDYRDRGGDRLSRSKRRRGVVGERLMMHNHNSRGEDGGNNGDDSSEESVNDEDEEDEDEPVVGVSGGSIRMLPPNQLSTTSISSSLLSHRKSFTPVHNLNNSNNNSTNNNKHFRPLTTLKVTDEMIGVSVPRKARSVSTKRSHEWPSSCGVVGGDQIHCQASTSPIRPMSVSAMAAPAPTSPSSFQASAARKKLKPNGPKLRPPKMSSSAVKTTSFAQEEIEIEIAEVLYGMMRQPAGPTKQEIVAATATDSIKFESAREAKNNNSTNDAKSCALLPPQMTSAAAAAGAFPQNSSSSIPSISAVAPKRKKPRPVKYEDETQSSIFAVQSSAISSAAKAVTDQPSKVESSSPNLEKNNGSAAENGGFLDDLANLQAAPVQYEAQPEPMRKAGSDSKPVNDDSETQNAKMSKEEPRSPKRESSSGLRLDNNSAGVDTTVTKAHSTMSEIENQREEKFQIDLMAPPPSRSSPERDGGEVDFVSVDPKPTVIDAATEIKPTTTTTTNTTMTREDDNNKAVKFVKEEREPANVEADKSKAEEAEFEKRIVVGTSKERNIDLHLDLEKTERDGGNAGFSASKLHHNAAAKQHNPEKTVQPSSVPLPMSLAAWPGGLPSMGYMAPLQGVVSMDGSTVSSAAIQPPHLLFNQPRPKRCSTHSYIAWNISYHQQMSRMNPFWPVAAGSGSLYGAKHCNPNVLPPELRGNIPGGGVNPAQDKGQGIAMFPGQSGKDKSSQAANLVDAAQRKQIVLQQALPPGAPSNMLHGPPAFIFPLSQQQAVAAASVRPGSIKSPNAGGAAALSSASNTASMSATTTPTPAPAMSFNYPNMAGNESQYLAILQNNAYPFPMPTHVGALAPYRGPHAQPMPYFNGSFYSSQLLHPSQLQQQQQQQQPLSQSQQNQQGHQNPSISSGSSSSQKHLQNLQQWPHPGGVNGGNGSLQGFPASKNQSSQPLQQPQQRQQQPNPRAPHQARQLEAEMGGEDSPSTADSRVSRPNMSIYGQNFAMPMHPPNFALLTPPSSGSAGGATGASGSEKKLQQQLQGSKAGVEASQAFAMSFASLNGARGLDLTSIAQNHAILQSFPEVTGQGHHQFMAVAVPAAQHKKNFRVPEEGKTGGGDSSNAEEERKATSTVGHSIAFSRPDLSDTSGSTIPGSNVIDSSARTLNLSSTPVRNSSSAMPAASNVNAPTPQQQLQQQMRNDQHQQQMIQRQKQQFSAASRSKTPATSNGSVYSDHLPSTSSMAAKFPNALSSFSQNLVQGSGSQARSPQWKNSTRTTTSQVPSSSLASSTSSSLKNLPQKHGRTQQSHTQISFAANTKPSTQSQGLQPASSSQAPSPPVMVGSPTTTTSSMKSAGGSPRTTTSNSTGNKAGQASSLSSQLAKNSPSVPSQKSSPVGGRNVPSILGNTHITSSGTGTKPQLPQQQQQHQHQQQQQISKQPIQPAQLFFSNPYMQAQASHPNSANSTASPASGYYHIPRRWPEQQQQQPQGSSGSSSSGMLSLCPPVTHSNTSTTDPAKAAAAAAANMKGGGVSSQTLMHHAQFAAAQSSGPHQLVPAGFPYVRAVPTVVHVKPAEQKKQPAGE